MILDDSFLLYFSLPNGMTILEVHNISIVTHKNLTTTDVVSITEQEVSSKVHNISIATHTNLTTADVVSITEQEVSSITHDTSSPETMRTGNDDDNYLHSEVQSSEQLIFDEYDESNK